MKTCLNFILALIVAAIGHAQAQTTNAMPINHSTRTSLICLTKRHAKRLGPEINAVLYQKSKKIDAAYITNLVVQLRVKIDADENKKLIIYLLGELLGLRDSKYH